MKSSRVSHQEKASLLMVQISSHIRIKASDSYGKGKRSQMNRRSMVRMAEPGYKEELDERLKGSGGGSS